MQTINKIIMTLAGLLLIVAAGLKFYEMIDTCVPSWQVNKLGFWESYEFFMIQIPLEFALGVWLVSGLFRKAAWIAGTLAYLGFIGVTIFKVATGAESCGCFGQIHVDPRITLFVMDIPIFLMLAIFRPKGHKLLPPPWPKPFYMLTIAVSVLAVMALAAPAMVTLRPDCIKVEDTQPDESAQLRLQMHKLKQELSGKQQEIDRLKQEVESLQSLQKNMMPVLQKYLAEKHANSEQSITDPNIVINLNVIKGTKPETPIETTSSGSELVIPEVNLNSPDNESSAIQQWDWLEFVVEDDVRQQIAEGLVVVMMHRFDCEVCEVMTPRYSEYYKQLVDQGADNFKIAFLAIPPYGDEDHVPDDTICIQGKLTDEKKWGLMSPYVVALLNGEKVKEWEQGTAPEPANILEEVFGK